MMGGYELRLTDAPSPGDEAAIDEGLATYNLRMAGYADARPLAVLATRRGTVVGGLVGRTTLGLFFIDLVWLPDAARGGGLGARMMGLAEDEARRRGCTAAVLFTIHFQAPGFYAALGYAELGRVECDPPGHMRLCMTKRLTPRPASR